MIDLTRLLPKLLRAHGGNVELAVKLAWSRVAGAGLRRHAIASRLAGKTLVVAVADALWQRQLEQMSRELLFKINTLLAQKVVDSLLFEVNSASFPSASETPPASDAQSNRRTAIPTELLFAAGSITDDDLRARFLRAAENCIERREALCDDNG